MRVRCRVITRLRVGMGLEEVGLGLGLGLEPGLGPRLCVGKCLDPRPRYRIMCREMFGSTASL